VIKAHLGQVILAAGKSFTADLSGNGLINFVINTPSSTQSFGANNTGSILADGGTVLLTAKAAAGILNNVINMSGIIQANSVSQHNGQIILSGGANGTTQVSGKLLAEGKESSQNGGNIRITGNKIIVNSSAEIKVSGAKNGGSIYINSDASLVYGKLLAQANTGNGGFIETSGTYINITGINVNTKSINGKTGEWLIDPADIVISSSSDSNTTETGNTWSPNAAFSNIDVNTLEAALANNNITIQSGNDTYAGNGNITVNDVISWSSAYNLTLDASANNIANNGNILINAAISNTNTGGLTLISGTNNSTITINAAISLTGGTLTLTAPNGTQNLNTGDITTTDNGTINVANFILNQGQWIQSPTSNSLPNFAVSNNFQINSGAQFTRLYTSNGNNYITDIFGLQGIATGPLDASYILNNNINAAVTATWNSGAGFTPIGNATTRFSGNFDGASYIIDKLFINQPTNAYIGLFGNVNLDTGNAIHDLGLTNVNITGGNMTGGLAGNVGGTSPTPINGNIYNIFVTGLVTGGAASTSPTEHGVGGLIGRTDGTTVVIQNSYSSANVVGTGTTSSNDIGGLIGQFNGSGGNGLIINSYATGSVTDNNTGPASNIGGLVGYATGTIINAYATGNVSIGTGTATTNIGGLIGASSSASVINSFWNKDTTGQTTSADSTNAAGYKGMTSAEMMTYNNFILVSNNFINSNTWDISATPTSATVWGMINGSSYPYLVSFYGATAPRIISGNSYAANGSTPISNQTIQIAVNGSDIISSGQIAGTVTTGANGFYYFLEPNSTISDNSAVLIYATTGTPANAVTKAPTSGGSIVGFDLTANALTIGDGSAPTLTETTLINAINGHSATGIVYSASGSSLTFNNQINLLGSLNTSSGIQIILGTSTLNIAALLNGNSTINGVISGSGNGINLLANSNGKVTFANSNTYSGITTISGGTLSVGRNTALGTNNSSTSLTLNGGTLTSTSSITLANPWVVTGNSTIGGTNNLTLNGAGSINSGTTLTVSNTATTTFGNTTAIGGSGSLLGSGTGSQTFNGDIGTSGTSLSSFTTQTGNINFTAATTNIYSDSITINGPLTANTLNLTAANTSQSITTGAAGSVSVTNFNLLQGQWYQVSASLPGFSVATNFRLNSGNGPSSSVQFIRATANLLTAYAIADIYGLQGIGSNDNTLGFLWFLNNNIDASNTVNWNGGAGFIPIGTLSNPFTGLLNGGSNNAFYTVDKLYQNTSATYAGLFGYISSSHNGAISKIGLTNVNLTSSGSYLGGIAGFMTDPSSAVVLINNAYVTGSINGGSGSTMGGLVGNFGSNSGGPIGTIQSSYNAATITATNGYVTGGIIGNTLGGTFQYIYNIGNVRNNGTGNVGGIIGQSCLSCSTGSTLAYSYNSGAITSSSSGSTIGAIIGNNNDTTFTYTYFDNQTSIATSAAGSGNSANITGQTTANMMAFSTFSSPWSGFITSLPTTSLPSTPWLIISGSTRPILTMEYSTNITNAHQLQLMAAATGESFTLNNSINFTSVTASDIWGSNFSGTTSGAGFAPIGTASATFDGAFDGQNNTINGLYINRPNTQEQGLFGSIGTASTILLKNVGLINANVTGGRYSGIFIGNVQAASDGAVSNVMVSGSMTGIGGNYIGGLIGVDRINISNSYSLARVTAPGSLNVGGLAGYLDGNKTITTSYSAGSVSGLNATATGGLVGIVTPGSTISKSFWDTAASGRTNAIGSASNGTTTNVTGGCFNASSCTNGGSVNLSQASTFSSSPYSWNISTAPSTNTWAIINGYSYPYLTAQYGSNTPLAISGISMNGGIAISGQIIQLAKTGGNITNNGLTQATAITAANGFYYFLEPYGTIANATNPAAVLTYTTTGTLANAITYAPAYSTATGGSIAGLNLTGKAITIGDNSTQTITPSALLNTSGLTLLASSDVNNNINLLATGNSLISRATTTISVPSNISITTNNANITINGPISVPGTSSFTATGGAISITNTSNNLVGVISLNNSGNNSVPPINNTISLVNNRATILGTVTVGTGTLTVSSNGAGSITQSGATIITTKNAASFSAGANNITLNNNNNFTGVISLNNSGSSNSASIKNNGPITLNTATIAGTLNVNYNSTLTFAGTISSFTNITLNNSNNSALLPTNLTALSNLKNLTINFPNSAIALPGLTLKNSGNLVVNVGRNISQTGALVVPGTSSFNTGAYSIMLANNQNAFSGVVTLVNSGSNNAATIINGASVALSLGTSTIRGNFSVTAAKGINLTGTINNNGNFTATSAKGINLNGTISSSRNFSVTAAEGINLTGTISNNGTFSARATKGINLNGTISNNGKQTWNSTITLTGNSTLNSGSSTVTNTISFLDMISNGYNLTITTAGNAIQAGKFSRRLSSLIVNGSGNVTLSQAPVRILNPYYLQVRVTTSYGRMYKFFSLTPKTIYYK